MKIKFSTKREVQIQPEILENKINIYLKKNFYRIIEKGPGFVVFIDDEYSNRKRSRSDYHIRIGEGKFEYFSSGEKTTIRLIYFTSVLYPTFFIMLFTGVGMYSKSLMPILFSFAFAIPILYKIYYLNENVFVEVLES